MKIFTPVSDATPYKEIILDTVCALFSVSYFSLTSFNKALSSYWADPKDLIINGGTFRLDGVFAPGFDLAPLGQRLSVSIEGLGSQVLLILPVGPGESLAIHIKLRVGKDEFDTPEGKFLIGALYSIRSEDETDFVAQIRKNIFGDTLVFLWKTVEESFLRDKSFKSSGSQQLLLNFFKEWSDVFANMPQEEILDFVRSKKTECQIGIGGKTL